MSKKKEAARRERAVNLSPWGWVRTIVSATWITAGLAKKVIRGISRKKRQDGTSFHQYVAYNGMRDYQGKLSPVRVQNLVTSTAKTCRRFAKKNKIPHALIELADGTVGHWLGPQDAAHHVVFFHGGGYMAPALNKHMDFAFGFTKPLRKNLAVIVLQYSLATEKANPYPCQLQQAISLLDHLLHERNISPNSIILLGDSAGGHLLIGLLLHFRHHNPKVNRLDVQGHFAGAAIVSPWLNLYAPAESMKPGPQQDILDPNSLVHWANDFLAGAPSDPWNDPLTAPKDWWTGLPVDDILLTFGEDELLRDGCATVAEILQQAHPSTSVRRVAKEVHVHMIMNRFLLINRPCESEEFYTRWMDSHLADKTKAG